MALISASDKLKIFDGDDRESFGSTRTYSSDTYLSERALWAIPDKVLSGTDSVLESYRRKYIRSVQKLELEKPFQIYGKDKLTALGVAVKVNLSLLREETNARYQKKHRHLHTKDEVLWSYGDSLANVKG